MQRIDTADPGLSASPRAVSPAARAQGHEPRRSDHNSDACGGARAPSETVSASSPLRSRRCARAELLEPCPVTCDESGERGRSRVSAREVPDSTEFSGSSEEPDDELGLEELRRFRNRHALQRPARAGPQVTSGIAPNLLGSLCLLLSRGLPSRTSARQLTCGPRPPLKAHRAHRPPADAAHQKLFGKR